MNILTGSANTKSASEILADIRHVHEQINRIADQPGEFGGLGPVKILENPMCVRDSDKPQRIHKRRRWMSDSYHRRIQKKWAKRFGYQPEYYAIAFDPRATGMPGESTLVVHPVIAQKMREEARLREMRRPFDALRRAALIGNFGSWL
ncbi:MAG TPA: hypothetical protein VF534_04390 [Paraburkholderia sp.]